MKKSKKGFTLIELVVVMAIIAFLMLVLIGGILVARSAANDAAMKTNANSVRLAIESFYSRNGSYPTLGTVTAGVAATGTNFATATGSGGALNGYGVSLNTQACSASGGGEATASSTAFTGRGGRTNINYEVYAYPSSTCVYTSTVTPLTGP